MDLQGKTALITGGSSGIGLATAILFAKHGARVAITGRDEGRLAEAAALIGGHTLVLKADVRSAIELAPAASRVAEEFSGLDVLFANAGVAFSTPLGSTPEARLDEIIDINVKGVFLTVEAFLPMMRDGGSIVLNTSWLADVGTAGLSALSASKAAVRSLARTWSAELLPRRIRVNAVSPGATLTPIHGKTGMSDQELAAFAEHVAAKIPLGRFGKPEDVAEAALFLAGDRSAYMLGAEIAVDGGFAQL